MALSCAIAIRPALLMLDEPYSSLDVESMRVVEDLTRKVVTEMQIPCLVVTHRVDDCHEIGDRVLVVSSGKKEWEGSPRDIPEGCSVCCCR